jgi:hypothetical protein
MYSRFGKLYHKKSGNPATKMLNGRNALVRFVKNDLFNYYFLAALSCTAIAHTE